ncbi:unnamed protein product [Prunus brigantina]
MSCELEHTLQSARGYRLQENYSFTICRQPNSIPMVKITRLQRSEIRQCCASVRWRVKSRIRLMGVAETRGGGEGSPRCPALKIPDEREGEREVEREGQREMEREQESFKLPPLKTANDENGEKKKKILFLRNDYNTLKYLGLVNQSGQVLDRSNTERKQQTKKKKKKKKSEVYRRREKWGKHRHRQRPRTRLSSSILFAQLTLQLPPLSRSLISMLVLLCSQLSSR